MKQKTYQSFIPETCHFERLIGTDLISEEAKLAKSIAGKINIQDVSKFPYKVGLPPVNLGKFVSQDPNTKIITYTGPTDSKDYIAGLNFKPAEIIKKKPELANISPWVFVELTSNADSERDFDRGMFDNENRERSALIRGIKTYTVEAVKLNNYDNQFAVYGFIDTTLKYDTAGEYKMVKGAVDEFSSVIKWPLRALNEQITDSNLPRRSKINLITQDTPVYKATHLFMANKLPGTNSGGLTGSLFGIALGPYDLSTDIPDGIAQVVGKDFDILTVFHEGLHALSSALQGEANFHPLFPSDKELHRTAIRLRAACTKRAEDPKLIEASYVAEEKAKAAGKVWDQIPFWFFHGAANTVYDWSDIHNKPLEDPSLDEYDYNAIKDYLEEIMIRVVSYSLYFPPRNAIYDVLGTVPDVLEAFSIDYPRPLNMENGMIIRNAAEWMQYYVVKRYGIQRWCNKTENHVNKLAKTDENNNEIINKKGEVETEDTIISNESVVYSTNIADVNVGGLNLLGGKETSGTATDRLINNHNITKDGKPPTQLVPDKVWKPVPVAEGQVTAPILKNPPVKSSAQNAYGMTYDEFYAEFVLGVPNGKIK